MKNKTKELREEKLVEVSKVFTEIWNLSEDELDKHESEYMELIRDLLYKISADPDDKESSKRMESLYGSGSLLRLIEQLIEKHKHLYHIIRTTWYWEEQYDDENK